MLKSSPVYPVDRQFECLAAAIMAAHYGNVADAVIAAVNRGPYGSFQIRETFSVFPADQGLLHVGQAARSLQAKGCRAATLRELCGFMIAYNETHPCGIIVAIGSVLSWDDKLFVPCLSGKPLNCNLDVLEREKPLPSNCLLLVAPG